MGFIAHAAWTVWDAGGFLPWGSGYGFPLTLEFLCSLQITKAFNEEMNKDTSVDDIENCMASFSELRTALAPGAS